MSISGDHSTLHGRGDQIGWLVCNQVPERDSGSTHPYSWGWHPSLWQIISLLQIRFAFSFPNGIDCVNLRRQSQHQRSWPRILQTTKGIWRYLHTEGFCLGELEAVIVLPIICSFCEYLIFERCFVRQWLLVLSGTRDSSHGSEWTVKEKSSSSFSTNGLFFDLFLS